MQNLQQLNWLELEVKDIVSKTTANGVKYLELFLQDYTRTFNKKVNPRCNNCVARYLKEFKKKYQMENNNTSYRLHKKREGIQLEFGSSKHITNAILTDEYAEILIKRFLPIKGEETLDFLFDKYPENTPTDNSDTEEKEDAELSLKELRERYPSISARSKEKFLELI